MMQYDEVLAQLPYAFVLNCLYFQGSKCYKQDEPLNRRLVYNYELEYFIKSQGGMYLNDTYIEIQPGDIIIRKPGDTTQGIMPYDCYLIVVGTTLSTYLEQHHYIKHADVLKESMGSHPILPHLSGHRHLDYVSDIRKHFEAIYDNHLSNSSMRDYKGHVLIEALLLHLYEEKGVTLGLKEKGTERFESVVAYMKQHLGEKVYLEELAEVAGFSLFHFNRVFKEQMGVTAIEYLNRLRIDAGKMLLASTKESVTQISQKVGFDTASYFSYVFKRHVSMTPKAYRKSFEYDFSG